MFRFIKNLFSQKPQNERELKSWTGVFKKKAIVYEVTTYDELRELMPIKVSGSLHSYNNIALGERVAFLKGPAYDFIYPAEDDTFWVGAATPVSRVVEVLLDHHRRLVNRGNFDRQTLVGAALTGTHGFGKTAVIADSIVESKQIGSAVVAIRIKTAPLTRYKVRQSAMLLKNATKAPTSMRAYAVLPYSSNDGNPVCLVADYSPIEATYKDCPECLGLSVIEPHHTHYKRAKPPVHLKLWWRLDQMFPPLRRVIQRALYHFRLDRTLVTGSHDVDAIYDPVPGIAGNNTWDFKMWAYRPTYVCYNVALFVRPRDTEAFIRTAIIEGEKLKKNLFRCMIGVRQLTDRGQYFRGGNRRGPRNAVDLYCSPKDAKHLIKLQRILQERFDTLPHFGKTVFTKKDPS